MKTQGPGILKVYERYIYICDINILYRFMARLEYYRYTTGILNGILEVD